MECCKYADSEVKAAKNIAHGVARLDRAAFRCAGHAHKAAHCLTENIISGALGVAAVAAVAGNCGIYYLIVDLFKHVIAKAKSVHNAGAVVFYDHVRLLDHLKEQCLALWSLEVERYALLAAVVHCEVCALAVHIGAVCTAVVAALWVLYLDYTRAHIAEHGCAKRTCNNSRQVKNHYVF